METGIKGGLGVLDGSRTKSKKKEKEGKKEKT
jgi:hypothetical protein